MTTHAELAPTSADQTLVLSTTLFLPRLPSHLRVHYHAVQTQSTQCNTVSMELTSSPAAGSEVFQVRVAGQKETLFFNCGL